MIYARGVKDLLCNPRYRSDGPETVAPDLLRVMDRVAEYAPPRKTAMPLANGEWGYGAAVVGSLEMQARLFVRQQLITIR